MNARMEKVNPKFNLGKEVYAILGPDRYCQGQVTAFRTWAINENGTILVLPNAVRLSTFTISDYFNDIESDAVPFCYLTDDEEKAKKWIEFIPVEFSNKDWFKAIGERPSFEDVKESIKNQTYDSDDSLEESELGICCANISNIRDVLIRCQKNNGLIGWEVERLKWLCEEGYHEFPEDAPTLKNIFEQLNVDWSYND